MRVTQLDKPKAINSSFISVPMDTSTDCLSEKPRIVRKKDNKILYTEGLGPCIAVCLQVCDGDSNEASSDQIIKCFGLLHWSGFKGSSKSDEDECIDLLSKIVERMQGFIETDLRLDNFLEEDNEDEETKPNDNNVENIQEEDDDVSSASSIDFSTYLLNITLIGGQKQAENLSGTEKDYSTLAAVLRKAKEKPETHGLCKGDLIVNEIDIKYFNLTKSTDEDLTVYFDGEEISWVSQPSYLGKKNNSKEQNKKNNGNDDSNMPITSTSLSIFSTQSIMQNQNQDKDQDQDQTNPTDELIIKRQKRT